MLLSSEEIFFILAAISSHRENTLYNSIFKRLSDFLISKDHNAIMNDTWRDDKHRVVEAMRTPIDADLNSDSSIPAELGADNAVESYWSSYPNKD
ncbi:hypothetical protein [Paracoccus gahaiensis]|uniref:hypothetical protein n=1 Tax=Paracoccus gahaiensis TaxID=1706839 RepID=UPI00145DC536|nr:hypothetical protein [Paracoccus gahaiensis]